MFEKYIEEKKKNINIEDGTTYMFDSCFLCACKLGCWGVKY